MLTSCKTDGERPTSISHRTFQQAFGQSHGLDARSLHQSHNVSPIIAAPECGLTGGVIGGVIVTIDVIGISEIDANSGPAGAHILRTSL